MESASRAGRIAFVGQWVAPFLAPLLLFVIRGSLCGCGGWLSGPGLFLLAPPLFVVLAVPAILVFADPVAVRRRQTGKLHGILAITLWLALVGVVITVVDGEPPTSLLSFWTGIPADGLPHRMMPLGFGLVAVLAWLGTVGLAVTAVVASRREESQHR
ncbi:MAG: hypothetical protein KIT69_07545 [Propionibacteriaceae bacterium]|nr:hypothetical protein [Propionibacteriaceae bacterium]